MLLSYFCYRLKETTLVEGYSFMRVANEGQFDGPNLMK